MQPPIWVGRGPPRDVSRRAPPSSRVEVIWAPWAPGMPARESGRGRPTLLTDPGVHGDGGRRGHIDGARRAVLADAQQPGAPGEQCGPDPLPLGAEDHEAALGKGLALQSPRAWTVVDGDHLVPRLSGPGEQFGGLGMMAHIEVPVGDHGAALVPAASADDVDSGDVEGVGRAHDGADVEVLAHILDGDMQWMRPGGEVGADGLDAPVAVAIDHVAPVAHREELAIVAGVGRPGGLCAGPGPHAHGGGVQVQRTGPGPVLALGQIAHPLRGAGTRSRPSPPSGGGTARVMSHGSILRPE